MLCDMAGRKLKSRLTEDQAIEAREAIEFLVKCGYVKRFSHLARMLGTSDTCISHWRDGYSNPSLEEFQKIMELVDKAKKFLEDISKAGANAPIHDNYIGNGVAVHSESIAKAEAVCNALRLRIATAITKLEGLDNDMRQRILQIILES